MRPTVVMLALSFPSVTTRSTRGPVSRARASSPRPSRPPPGGQCRRSNRPAQSRLRAPEDRSSSARPGAGLSAKFSTNISSCGIRRACECERGRLHLGPERPHAAAVIDEQAKRHRNVVAPEDRDGLPPAVLEHGEGLLTQIRDQLAVAVGDCGVQHDEAGLGAEHRLPVDDPNTDPSAPPAPRPARRGASSHARRARSELELDHRVGRELHLAAPGENVAVDVLAAP